jgi:hypothetical protein
MIAPGEHFGGPDISNRFLVGYRATKGPWLCILNPPTTMPISREDGLNLAAWIVALADPSGRDFQRVLEAIKNSK